MEVFRGDGGGNRRGVGALDVCGVGDPSCGAECGVVEDAGVEIDQAFTDAVFDRREIGGPQLVEDEAAEVSCGERGGAAGLTLRSEGATWSGNQCIIVSLLNCMIRPAERYHKAIPELL